MVVASLSLEAELNSELDRLGESRRWVWTLLIVATVPNIMSGLHLNSYVFLGKMPTAYWCDVPVLRSAGWTTDQIRQISTVPGLNDACSIASLDYADLAHQTIGNVSVRHRHQILTHPSVPCLDGAGGTSMQYSMEGDSIVSEWDLVCKRSALRPLTQTSISLGKASGAILAGLMSDRYGRRLPYMCGAVLFVAVSVVMSVTPWYWPFMAGRLGAGLASGLMFYPAVILVSENVSARQRFLSSMWLHCGFPLGMMYLAAAAYFYPTWRLLQLALTVPAVCLLVNIYFFKESPRWLISKGRLLEAHSVLFGKLSTATLAPAASATTFPTTATSGVSVPHRPGMFREVVTLYGHAKYRPVMLICHYIYLTASFSYYVSVINADNLAANRIVYVLGIALVDMAAYVLNALLLPNVGRRWNLSGSFAVAGLCYLAMYFTGSDDGGQQNDRAATVRLVLALCARLCICAAYGISSLYVAELFPTVVRSTALGACSMLAHSGSMCAAFAVDLLGRIAWHIPTTMCGVALFVGAWLVFLCPETSDSRLDDFVPPDGKTVATDNGV